MPVKRAPVITLAQFLEMPDPPLGDQWLIQWGESSVYGEFYRKEAEALHPLAERILLRTTTPDRKWFNLGTGAV